MSATILQGDVIEQLRTLEPESVHCVVTSPPYWGLRNYGVDGQLGLEKTPEEYVEKIVAVFREVRRVLREDGTCWVNMGDGYTGANNTNVGGNANWGTHPGRDVQRGRKKTGPGLKPKDLIGMPWRLAFALQQPYYTGRIKDASDRRWLAGIVDSEGSIHIHRRKAGADSGAKFTRKDGTEVSYARMQNTYSVMVSIDNTSKALVDRCEEIIGQGSRYVHEKATGKQQRKQTLYRLTLTGQQSRDLLRELYPDLVAKQREARIAYHSPSSGEGAAACHEAIKALHNGADATVDKPAPPTLFEPGWYVRSDIIWGKSNPMPESVTDRPTKSHEYVFLLTKSARYYYDADAVMEKGSGRCPGNRQYKYDGIEGHETKQGIMAQADVPQVSRNLRSVWTIATEPYPEAHFATFPRKLVEPCIRAGTSLKGCCAACGAPRERMQKEDNALGWRPSCDCGDGVGVKPCVVVDPFAGTGTVGVVAHENGCDSILIELNPEYVKLMRKRLAPVVSQPLLFTPRTDESR